jgi:hypothetical protein
MFNTTIEALCDFLEPAENQKMGIIKDIGAAAAGISILVWCVALAVEVLRVWQVARWPRLSSNTLPSDHAIVSVLLALHTKGSENAKNKQNVDDSKDLQAYNNSPIQGDVEGDNGRDHKRVRRKNPYPDCPGLLVCHAAITSLSRTMELALRRFPAVQSTSASSFPIGP